MENNLVKQEKFGLTGSTLKIIAIISMAIDHFGAAVVYYMLSNNYSPFCDIDTLQTIYDIMRKVGRLAFPIYCFLIVEGFYYTSNRKKYAIRLGIFALISEIPFDLAFYNSLAYWNHQNVFFTLFVALITITLMDRWKVENLENPTTSAIILANVKRVGVVIVTSVLATVFSMDYYLFGILAIVIMYLTRENRFKQCILGAVFFTWEIPASLAYIPVYLYNGKRGLKMKYFFYIFYPAHLLIFYFVRVFVLKL